VIPLLAQSSSDIPLHLEPKQYRDFTGANLYSSQFKVLLEDIRGHAGVALKDEYRGTRLTYVTAPPTVANYIERPEAFRALRDALFADGQHQPIALTALAGMGGIGKTVLAKALTQDDVVLQAFPDGIVWITIGRESNYDPVSMFHKVGRALGEDWERHKDPMACEDEYRTAMAKKAALVVVDDVWKKSDLDPFLAESKRSRLLYTTRDAAIARFVGAREHTVQLLEREQARELLAAWADLQGKPFPGEADAIIDECGSLPLALSQIGAVLRDAGHEVWKDTLDLLRKADLKGITEQLPPSQESFFRAVEVSFAALAPEMQERYKALAVLLEDMAAPFPILETLWGVKDAEARRISRYFVDRSLAQRDRETGSIRLHDLQVDYLRAQYADRQALDLIHCAVRLSSHVIERDPKQFASQLVGRLLPHHQLPAVKQLAESVIKATPRPWLRPLIAELTSPGGPLLRILTGHRDAVTAVAVTPDGKQAVSASHDCTLKVWDLANGRELRALTGHRSYVVGVAVTPDGRQAVSASWDRTLKVWDLSSGRELRTLAGHAASVNAVAVTPDGKQVVSASNDLKVWDLSSGRELRTLAGYARAVAVTPDGKQAVSASDDLKVWDLSRGRELRTLAGHRKYVMAVAVTPDGRKVVSASWDQTLKVWDLASGRELRTLTGHTQSVNAVAVTPDGQHAVSASSDQTLKLWDLTGGRVFCTLIGHSRGVDAVVVTPDGKQAVSASEDRTLKVWDLSGGRELQTLAARHSGVLAVAVTPDGRQAVSAYQDCTLKVWDLASGRELRTLTGHRRGVNAVAVTPDGQHVVSASSDQTLKVWDLASGRELRTLTGHRSHVMAVALTPDGQQAVSASDDWTLKVWDLPGGQELRTIAGHSGVATVAVTPDGQQAVSASNDRTLKVWDLSSGRELRTLTGHDDVVRPVAVTPDGQQVVSVSRDQTLRVWDLATGTVIATFTCDAAVWCCAVTCDRKIVAGDESGRLHFLQLELDEDQLAT
jgi:WD40 repeat protein